MKTLIKKFVPKQLVSLYHLAIAYLGAIFYGFPTRKMVVIGVTGTRGKTTTANFIWSVFTAAGYKTGLTGTANVRIGEKEEMNHFHMTMPGRFAMQKMLAKMRRADCEIVIVETPSEGIEQNRHRGIFYDALVLTTLYPEYLETHGWSFERLKDKIEELFALLALMPRKSLRGENVPKIMILPADLPEKERFSKYPANLKITYGAGGMVDLEQIKADELNLVGSFNIANALPAIALGRAFKIPEDKIRAGLNLLKTVPGRMEKINAGQPFTVFVDYAHDGPSIEAALTASREIAAPQNNKVIIVLGGEGGGRDKKKRPIMGELAARLADFVIVTNVDPYDDDPKEIIEDIARASEAAGKIRGQNLFTIEDRREGINKALELATASDVVLITGKGAEQSMIIGKEKIKWDDREVVKEEISKL